MRIKEITSQHGRDFSAVMECEHCGGTQKITTGYNDGYYHGTVIPAESNDHGMKHVEARLAEVERERDEVRDELDGITEVLDVAGVPKVTDGPDGRRWTLGLVARVEHVIAERDEARAEVERLRAALAGEGEVESLIPVDVDLLGLRLRATHPSPDDVGEAGSYQIMRLRTRRGEPILIDCGAGREIKITVRPSAGGATPEKARQGEKR